MPLDMKTVPAKIPDIRIQVNKDEFPHQIDFIEYGPQGDLNPLQYIQPSNQRYLGNVDQLLERERQRLRLELQEEERKMPNPLAPAPLPPKNPPGTPPAPPPPNGGYGGNCGGK